MCFGKLFEYTFLIGLLGSQLSLSEEAAAPDEQSAEAGTNAPSTTVTQADTAEQTRESEEEKETEPPKFQILELSVHEEDVRVFATVVWRDQEGELSASFITDLFSYEWLKVPEAAKDFVVVYATEKFKLSDVGNVQQDSFHSLDLPSKDRGKSNLYISLREATPAPKILRGRVSRAFRTHQAGNEGWVYVGRWDYTNQRWRSVFWVDFDYGPSLVFRKPIFMAPDALVERFVMPDFPLALREGPSTGYEQKNKGVYVRPGLVCGVRDIKVTEVDGIQSVWAKIQVVNQNENE